MPSEWELVLDLGDEYPHEYLCYYYFVNRSNRTLFWLHEFDSKPILNGLGQIKSKRRIRKSEFLTSVVFRRVTVDPRTSTGGLVLVSSYRGRILWRLIVTRSHWEMFPHDREVPDKLLKELVGIMMHAGLGESLVIGRINIISHPPHR